MNVLFFFSFAKKRSKKCSAEKLLDYKPASHTHFSANPPAWFGSRKFDYYLTSVSRVMLSASKYTLEMVEIASAQRQKERWNYLFEFRYAFISSEKGS